MHKFVMMHKRFKDKIEKIKPILVNGKKVMTILKNEFALP